jgi:hypothetical protein
MSEPSPEAVALWISEEGSNDQFKSLNEVLMEVLSSRLTNLSEEAISEIAEKIEPRVIYELEEQSNQSYADGILSRYNIFLEGSTAYIKFIARPEVALLRRLQDIAPTDFENFCKQVLDKLGAQAFVEGGTNDGGIDFIAFGLSMGVLGGPAPAGAKVAVIGQAKRYATDNNITENNLRSFVGAAIRREYLLKINNPSQVGYRQPIVYAYWTTSDFNKNARIYAREMGLWYLNGLALTQLALRSGLRID